MSRPARIAPITICASPVLSLQFGSLTRHSASFIPQPQRQGRARRSFSAATFWAVDRPVKSTLFRFVTVCQSTCLGSGFGAVFGTGVCASAAIRHRNADTTTNRMLLLYVGTVTGQEPWRLLRTSE